MMRYLTIFSLVFCLSISIVDLSAQADQVSPYAEDVTSIDNLLEALYASISGDKGVERDWDRFHNLFIKDARLIPSRPGEAGEMSYQVFTPEEYSSRTSSYFKENGFFEKEIFRVVEEYGSLVHAFSTYESYRTSKDETPFARGINSIQLMKDDNRWWVVSIYLRAESEELPLTEKYLPKK
ncbi:MAG: hypothetical protein AAF242_02470 [Bacteroidota bacterium]